MEILDKRDLEKRLGKPQKIFIAGYTTLTAAEKKEADKLIAKLKRDGHEITLGY